MKIIVINGKPKSGKDAFVQFIQEELGNRCANFSTVDLIKEAAIFCGWDGTKTPRNRAFLSDLKNLLINWNDVPYKDIENKIKRFKRSLFINGLKEEDGVVFIHCREPEEIKKFVERLDAKTLIISRPEVEEDLQSNKSDCDVYNYAYDYIVENTGNLDELREKAIKFIPILYSK